MEENNCKNKRKAEKDYEEDLKNIWEKYLRPSYEKSAECSYYVPDIENCKKNEVSIIFVCESPHTEEIEAKPRCPLMGDSGKDVAKVLFNIDGSFGLLVKNKDKRIENFHIAIVNVSNVPLQDVGDNAAIVKDLNMGYLRGNAKVIPELSENLLGRLQQYNTTKKRRIIVCGEFARAYIDNIKIKNDDNFSNDEFIYVPHPSMNQWSLIFNYKNDFDKMVHLFEKRWWRRITLFFKKVLKHNKNNESYD